MVSICILWLMVFEGAILVISSPIVFEDSIWLEDMSWPTMLFIEDMSRPIMLIEDMSRPIMFMEDISRPIMLLRPWPILLMDEISWPIMLYLVDMSRPILFKDVMP